MERGHLLGTEGQKGLRQLESEDHSLKHEPLRPVAGSRGTQIIAFTLLAAIYNKIILFSIRILISFYVAVAWRELTNKF
jgi:hypothetical protein